MMRPVAVGIDVGGSRLRAATVAADGTVLDRRQAATPAGEPHSLVERLAEVAGELGRDLPVGVGIAGLVTPRGEVRYGPNIDVRDLPLARELGAVLDGAVLVTNDASAAVVGEQRAGAGVGHDDVVLFTLGTGVGGGIVAGGRLLLGGGFAGELGHVVVRDDGRRCGCGARGCLEAYASGTAIAARAAERLTEPRVRSSLSRVARPTGEDVTAAAREGDALAVEVLREAGHWLGVAVASVVNALDPAVVVVGGGAGRATAQWVVPVAAETMREHLVGAGWRSAPDLVLAELGDDAGVVGAALLAWASGDRSAGRPRRSGT